MRLHWSVYFDDFFVIEDEIQSKHTGLIVMALFNLLGWGVSEEKGAGFPQCGKSPWGVHRFVGGQYHALEALQY